MPPKRKRGGKANSAIKLACRTRSQKKTEVVQNVSDIFDTLSENSQESEPKEPEPVDVQQPIDAQIGTPEPPQAKSETVKIHKKFGKFRFLSEPECNQIDETPIQAVQSPTVELEQNVALEETNQCEEKMETQEEVPDNTTAELVEQVAQLEVKEDDVQPENEPLVECMETEASVTESIVVIPNSEEVVLVEEPVEEESVVETVETDEFASIERAMKETSLIEEGIKDEIIESDNKIEIKEDLAAIPSTETEAELKAVLEEEVKEEREAEVKEILLEHTKEEPIEEEEKEQPTQEVVEVPKIEQISTTKKNKKSVPKPPRKQPKKEPKPKKSKGEITFKLPSKGKQSKNSKKEEQLKDNKNDDLNIRRSSRIKTISNQKKSSKGKVQNKKESSELCSESSNNSLKSEDKSQDSPIFIAPNATEIEHKPVKVKSRWRRSSELEMNTTNIKLSPQVTDLVVANQHMPMMLNEKKKGNNEEVERRLKQFVHLKENQYLTERISCKEAKKMTCDCFLTDEEIDQGEYGCGEDCLNRLLMIECGNLCPVAPRCTNKRFQKGQIASVEVFDTEKKGLGIRATANIPYGEFVLEYVGEVLDPEEFDQRATEYSKEKNPHYYFMALRADAVIDATRKGNISRFINHSCDPNAETQKWTVNGELRIGFFSKRTILAGEEITFDYQFQRYGKEAQKCYCGSPICRGWLGEEPDDDDDYEDDEDDEEEEEDEEVKEGGAEAKDDDKNEAVVKEIVKKPKPPKKERKPRIPKPKRKPRKDIFEDLDLDDEIDTLQTTGLKNQAHTLKLSRLMVRAKEVSQRTKLLKLLKRGEVPCRRLFLDYHGLRLIHGWMVDTQTTQKSDDNKLDCLRLEILQTLAMLPIPNKTMLQDSKVLATVEKWSTSQKPDVSPADSESNSPKLETEVHSQVIEPAKEMESEPIKPLVEEMIVDDKNLTEEKSEIEDKSVNVEKSVNIEKSANIEKSVNIEKSINEDNPLREEKIEDISAAVTEETLVEQEKQIVVEELKEIEAPKESPTEIKMEVDLKEEPISSEPVIDISEEQDTKPPATDNVVDKIIEDFSDMFEEESVTKEQIQVEKKPIKVEAAKPLPPPPPKENTYDVLVEIVALALKLLEEWASLKEVFRIPKKERIEQMKEHEREADRRYKALSLEQENIDKKRENRYRAIQRSRYIDSVLDKNRKPMKNDDRHIIPMPKISKFERRKLFAMQVEQAEQERRRKQQEMWNQHVKNCMMIGTDPRFTAPFDPNREYQCIWNPQIGQWQNYRIPEQQNVMYKNYPYQGQNIPQGMVPPNMAPPNMPAANMGTMPPMPNIPPMPSLPYQDDIEDPSKVRFMGPIPPPVKLPPKWKSAKDKYGRPYYYHVKLRKTQWEPPEFPQNDDYLSETTSSSDTSSLSSESSSDDSDSDDIDDTRLMLEIKNKFKKLEAQKKVEAAQKIEMKMMREEAKLLLREVTKPIIHEEAKLISKEESKLILREESKSDGPKLILRKDDSEVMSIESDLLKQDSILLKAEQILAFDASGHAEEKVDKVEVDAEKVLILVEKRTNDDVGKTGEPPIKKRRAGLVQEIIISPRTDEDKQQFKEDIKKYKMNKEKLKKQKEIIIQQTKKHMKSGGSSSNANPSQHKEHKEKDKMKRKHSVKAKLKELEANNEGVKKIKETFRSKMATVMVSILNAYRKTDCPSGRITNNEDFKHLARKLTHFVMLKELKHCQKIEDLICTDSVKSKAKEFVRKYMSKFGEVYQRPPDDLETY